MTVHVFAPKRGLIRMEQQGNHIYDQICYEVKYNIATGEAMCTCPGFTFLGKCKHADLHKIRSEKFLEDAEMMRQ
mgnify:FL=1